MLYQPTFNDHALNESFYQALIRRFIDDLTPSTQALLEECSFGIAPNSAGVKTFFILAASRTVADQLIQDHNNILHRVNTLMAGMGQIAICVVPPQNPTEDAPQGPCNLGQSDRSLPQYMMCKMFQLADVSDSPTDFQ